MAAGGRGVGDAAAFPSRRRRQALGCARERFKAAGLPSATAGGSFPSWQPEGAARLLAGKEKGAEKRTAARPPEPNPSSRKMRDFYF